ncbi:hypothetical protein OOT46_16860 [Aquabacterium sp. A7-Y]|uniref:hypothetical protein n=1 Tax=Aquabacterium sp. A7-Y TaxID=1349605 RepID=UPI00223D2EA7|nr:hypothetical protein [Aquabacterium sp. A7-Y]MCW7539515.1 hypothetical protein [Aquabacterium sp. A7-Y]
MLTAYFFRFHAMDQSLRSGQRDVFEFFLDPYWDTVRDIEIVPEFATLVFRNHIWTARTVTVACTIHRIMHPDLGKVRSIDVTAGLYRIEAEDRVVWVDPEEESVPPAPPRSRSTAGSSRLN